MHARAPHAGSRAPRGQGSQGQGDVLRERPRWRREDHVRGEGAFGVQAGRGGPDSGDGVRDGDVHGQRRVVHQHLPFHRPVHRARGGRQAILHAHGLRLPGIFRGLQGRHRALPEALRRQLGLPRQPPGQAQRGELPHRQLRDVHRAQHRRGVGLPAPVVEHGLGGHQHGARLRAEGRHGHPHALPRPRLEPARGGDGHPDHGHGPRDRDHGLQVPGKEPQVPGVAVRPRRLCQQGRQAPRDIQVPQRTSGGERGEGEAEAHGSAVRVAHALQHLRDAGLVLPARAVGVPPRGLHKCRELGRAAEAHGVARGPLRGAGGQEAHGGPGQQQHDRDRPDGCGEAAAAADRGRVG
mmetsp:Transcript_65325/g.206389  ORF Transcript_65325/g.206389 Transcript_65325/m.206389 type:complete len:352 (+) Transcript_65325:760-1815(+)